jgi:DNA-binding transcriptional LysR family regulator
MDASDLRIFEAVARLGSMSKAALELNTVQSNVTARIRGLEQELGVELLYRNHRGVRPTPSGDRLLPYCSQVSRLLDDAKRATLDTGTPSGPLTVGTLETTAAIRLSPLLTRFAQKFPDVDLVLRTAPSAQLVAQVLDRELDGAFVAGPANHPELDQQLCFDEELVLFGAPNQSLTACLNNRDLKIIVPHRGCAYRLRLEDILARRGIVGYRILEFGTMEAIFSCVSAGIGITLLPRQMANAVWDESKVSAHDLTTEESRISTYFVRRKDTFASSAERALVTEALALWQSNANQTAAE